jgi:hypothetical protein
MVFVFNILPKQGGCINWVNTVHALLENVPQTHDTIYARQALASYSEILLQFHMHAIKTTTKGSTGNNNKAKN